MPAARPASAPRRPAGRPARRPLLAAAALAAALLAALVGAGVALAAGPADPSTASRPSLLPLVQPLWSELTPAQQQVLAPFGDHWNTLPLEEKRAWVRLADRFPRMKPAQQAKASKRIAEWAALSPEQRRIARANYRLAKSLPKDERIAEWEQYQQMTPEQRAVLRVSGSTSNTAARHAGSRTGLAKEAAQPISHNVPAAPARVPAPPPSR